MRRLLSALAVLSFCLAAGAAPADDTACIASPTRLCVLGMALEATQAAGQVVSMSSSNDQAANDRFLDVWKSWVEIVKTSARAGELDFSVSTAKAIDEKFKGASIADLISALKLSGREADLAELLKQTGGDEKSGDMIFGPALIAAGRSDDFKAFAASRNYSPYDLAAMEAAGNFLAGKPDLAQASIETQHGSYRRGAGVNALGFLSMADRLDLAEPLLKYQDLDTADGVEACARVAQATKGKELAERCLAAASPLPEKTANDGAYGYAIAPQLVGALAAAGDWEQALDILRQIPPDVQPTAVDKLARFARSPELLPTARKALGSPGPMAQKRGGYLVRMLVLAGQADEAEKFVAAAPDDAARQAWTGFQAEALAEAGDTARALPLAAGITDPVSKAHALCAVAKALKN